MERNLHFDIQSFQVSHLFTELTNYMKLTNYNSFMFLSSDNYYTLNIDEKRIIGIKMGHSIEIQAEYVKIDMVEVKESEVLNILR